jgi:hypothetical protein
MDRLIFFGNQLAKQLETRQVQDKDWAFYSEESDLSSRFDSNISHGQLEKLLHIVCVIFFLYPPLLLELLTLHILDNRFKNNLFSCV